MDRQEVVAFYKRVISLVASLFPKMFAGLYGFGSFAAFLPHGEQYTSYAVWTDKEGRLRKSRFLDPSVPFPYAYFIFSGPTFIRRKLRAVVGVKRIVPDGYGWQSALILKRRGN